MYLAFSYIFKYRGIYCIEKYQSDALNKDNAEMRIAGFF